MAISVLLLMICAIVLIFMVPHSRYGLPLFFMISGVVLATLSVLFQYYSSSTYVPPAYLPFRNLDIYLYRFVGRSFKLPMTFMQTLRNISVVAYLCGVSFLLDVIRSNLKHEEYKSSARETIISKCVLVLLSLFYLFFYSPDNAYRTYLRYQRSDAPAGERLQLFFVSLHVFVCVLIALYMFYPLAFFLINIIRKKVTCFTNTVILLCSCVTLIHTGFYYFMFLGIFRNKTSDVFTSGFWFFNKISRIPSAYISLYPVISLILLILIIISINGFFALDLVSYSQNRILKKQIDNLNYNLKDVVHSEKNLMFSISILANEALASYGTDDGREKLERILDISNKQMNTVSESLNYIKLLHIRPGAVDLKSLTDSALESANVPEDVTVTKKYCDFPALCTLDIYHTEHALLNLIVNSLDSLAMSDTEHKELIISIDASKEWIYWSLYDNGSGLNTGSVRKYLMPFTSTKSKNTSWGIGLPYAFRVISTQLGQMRITGSTKEKNRHALVEILLPRTSAAVPKHRRSASDRR